jgi:hypothetical protein
MDFVLLYIGIIIILILGSMIVTLQNKITRLNITVDKIAKQIGVVEITEDMTSELTGRGLQESFDYIERLRKNN